MWHSLSGASDSESCNVTVTIIKTTTPELVLRCLFTEGWSRNKKQGVGVGPGSAARNSRTSRRDFSKSGLPPLYYCRWTSFGPFRAPNLSESKFDCPEFLLLGNNTLLPPLY